MRIEKKTRVLKFECCKVMGNLDHCGNSGYINNFGQSFNYECSSKFITDWMSQFSWWQKIESKYRLAP